MEKIKKYCVHCHQPLVCLRNPQQRYCEKKKCQNARKNLWRKHKKANDKDYQANQRRSNKTWHQCHPGYWRQYRQSNPIYTQQNREKQKIRDKKRSDLNASHLAKSDASPTIKSLRSLIKPGFYHIVPVTQPNLAKSDALIVEIAVITSSSTQLGLQ